jgi:hypothetical protein
LPDTRFSSPLSSRLAPFLSAGPWIKLLFIIC